jgi:hypothetical protein
LLHDNAPAHKAASVYQFLTPKNVTNLYHPPHSPDVSPPDYFLFPKLKMKLKGLHFADVAETQEAVTDELKTVLKEEFSAAFQKIYDRAKTCIYASGAYFEFKKVMCLPHLSSIFKKISPKTSDRTVCALILRTLMQCCWIGTHVTVFPREEFNGSEYVQ